VRLVVKAYKVIVKVNEKTFDAKTKVAVNLTKFYVAEISENPAGTEIRGK